MLICLEILMLAMQNDELHTIHICVAFGPGSLRVAESWALRILINMVQYQLYPKMTMSSVYILGYLRHTMRKIKITYNKR